MLFGVPIVGDLYTTIAGTGQANLILRAIVAGICLLPPTLLMGATLPAIARWVEATPSGVSWLGYFYGGNLAGAVVGSLLAGFYLLRVYDMPTATFAAVALNVVVALLALAIARAAYEAGWGVPAVIAAAPVRRARRTSRLRGDRAVGADRAWARRSSGRGCCRCCFGATTYTFSLILAVFLVGLGIGSSLGAGDCARLPQSAHRARLDCQLLLCAAHCVGRAYDRRVAAVLADQSVDFARARSSTSSSI